jgi:hypothetical protein
LITFVRELVDSDFFCRVKTTPRRLHQTAGAVSVRIMNMKS